MFKGFYNSVTSAIFISVQGQCEECVRLMKIPGPLPRHCTTLKALGPMPKVLNEQYPCQGVVIPHTHRFPLIFPSHMRLYIEGGACLGCVTPPIFSTRE